jgi:benzylsuccinate CoA-transferase BbsF subunit
MNRDALQGVRVADFSWVWAGPLATLLLSFMGAEVIKIESRKRIDQARRGSITTGDSFSNFDASPIFNNANLNKKGVTIDLSRPEGAELAKKLVAVSDVAIENMRSGVMDKLGLGYKELVKVKPDLIMLASSGFGSSGPYREYAGYAPIFASFGGLAHLTGYEDGPPNTMSGVMDLRVGTVSAFAILAALIRRQETGEGLYIDVSSTDCISTLVGPQLMEYSMNRRSPFRTGNQDSSMAPHNCYRCKGNDKWISIAVATDQEWNALCRAMGNPAWVMDKDFSDAYRRWKNRATLDALIGKWTINHTHYEVMALLQNSGVAAMPSFNAEEILSDPHIKERGVMNEVQHPVLGKKVVLNPSWKHSETPARIHKASPLLGEDNEQVFGDLLGMSKEEIKRLEEAQIIY